MAKKHWIYIKRGLSEDPKHRAAMGECVWLYMHIIDRADWETGIAFDWKDREEAADMSMPVDTLRRQRQKLEELDYIRTKQKQHCQDIYIMEWRNPRDYGCEVRNPRNPAAENEGSHEQPPSENEGLNQGSNQGSNQDGNQVQAQVKTPSSTSKSKSSSKSSIAAKPKANSYPQLVIFKETVKRYPAEANWDDVCVQIDRVGQRLGRAVTRDDLLPFYKFWTGKGYNPFGLGWLEWAVRGQTPTNGKVAEQWTKPTNFDNNMAHVQNWLQKQGDANV